MSYISTLNLLNADSPIPITEEAFQEELALWANAQFSFDIQPGTALVEEENSKDKQLFDTLTKLTEIVQPPSVGYHSLPKSILPKIAPAPGPVSGIEMLKTKKRKVDDESENCAEDDKRKRNTAASARFRLKKKLREKALEEKSNQLTAQVEKLENRVKELELETKWLRALVLEKDPSLLSNQ